MKDQILKTSFAFAAALLASSSAMAAGAECNTGNCGTPNQTGGGCGCGCGCSVLIAFTDQGDTYQYADDYDDDGREDEVDNCPFNFNPDQADDDGDARGDGCDNCPTSANFDLRDSDADGSGDACDNDDDEDTFLDFDDNCVSVPNPDQANVDGDILGNACDVDDDDDGCDDAVDNCVLVPAGNCLDSGAIDPGLHCADDFDFDGIDDQLDLCPGIVSHNADGDNDGAGDECDADLDNDGVDNTKDSCQQFPNLDQRDIDHDGLGDVCDPHLCFVIDPNRADDCLDPDRPFDVHAGKPMKTKTGDDIILHLFANRESTSIRYTWTVKSMPKDGDAAIENPKGSVSVSNLIEYVYEKDREPRFSARVPGKYEIEVLAELAFPDQDEYPTQKTAKSKVTIDVGGNALPKALCGGAPAGNVPMAALLGLLVIPMIRRRRK